MNRKLDWSKIISIAIPFFCIFAVVGLAYAAGEGHGEAMHHDSLSPAKIKDFLLRIMNFTGLVIILVWALKKPLVNTLNSRRQTIKEQFDDLDTRRAEAEQLYKEYEGKLSGIDEEVKKIIDAAVAQGQAEKQKIIDEANRAAGDIKRQAEMAMQYELAMSTKQLRQEVAEQVVLMAEEIIRKSLKPEDQERLIEGYLDKVGGIQ